MIRSIGALIAGIVTAFASIYLIEMLGHMIYPPPADLDFSDPEAIRPYIATLPIIALLFPMFGWFVGAFAGSLVADFCGDAKPYVFAAIVGGLVLAGTIANLIIIPHPLWFSIISLIGIVASAWLATRVTVTGNSSRNSSE